MDNPKKPNGTKDLVTIIIPTYNRARRVCDAVDSALAQTYKNTEVVVVDDCSTDGTAERLEERYGGRITVLRRGLNGGAAAARNTGIRAACGRWIRGLDSDDVMAPTAIADFVEAAASVDDPERCLFFSDCWVVYEDGGSGGERRVPALSSPYNGTDAAKAAARSVWGSGVFFAARSVFTKQGYFREDLRYSEDLEWILRMLLVHGLRFRTLPKLLLEYTQHPDGTMTSAREDVLGYRDRVLREVAERLGPTRGGRLLSEFDGYEKEQAEHGAVIRLRRKAVDMARRRATRLYLACRGVGDGFSGR